MRLALKGHSSYSPLNLNILELLKVIKDTKPDII